MMLKKFYLCALLMSFGMGSLNAAAAANYDPSNGQWRVIGEYLYWQPSVDDTNFVIDYTNPETLTGTIKHNKYNFHSGYRVGGAYLFCDCNRELQITYTNLNFKQNRSVTGTDLTAIGVGPGLLTDFTDFSGTASSHHRFDYQNIDAFYAQQLYDCCCLDFAVQIGLEAVELKLHEHLTFTSTDTVVGTGEVHHHSKFEGIGPKVGFAVGYELYRSDNCNCPGTLSLNVLTSGSILAAETKTHVDNVQNGVTELDLSAKREWRVVPVLHARAGLNYDTSFSCVDASLEVGYEFTSFLRGLSRQSPDGIVAQRYNNFDLQGLYVSASVTF